MEISNPRRILAVSLTDSVEELSRVVRDLTGSLPEPTVVSPPPATIPETATSSKGDTALAQPLPDPAPSSTLAGTTHVLSLKTAYYTATVPIWLDLISSPSEWSASFLSDEAKEVLEVLGGVVVVFPLVGSPSSSGSSTVATKELITHVGRVVHEGLGGVEWEGVSLAVGVSSSPGGEMTTSSGEDLDNVLDEWEDCCWEAGLEFVHHRAVGDATTKKDESGEKGRNEFGEKMGISRVLEALQANEWSGAGADLDEENDDEFGFDKILGKTQRKQGGEGGEDGELDPESLEFGFDREDFAGLRKAIWKGGGDGDEEDEEEDLGDDDVQKLERMMHKLQAVRDMTSGMPEEQRKRMAKRAVDEVMKEL